MKKIILKFIYWRLAQVAKKVINKHQPVVIAITGSVGKTSTKEAIAALFEELYPGQTRATFGNLNAEIGIPLSVLGYKKVPSKLQWPGFLWSLSKHFKDKAFPKFLVLEMGVEHPGDIEYFTSIVQPNIALITAATPVHLANFNDLDQLQQEKLSLSGKMKENGKVIYNKDDEFLRTNLNDRHIGYGIGHGSFCRAEYLEISMSGNNYELVLGEKRVKIHSRLIGRQMVYADLAAMCVADIMGVEIEKAKCILESRDSFSGRMNLLEGKNNIQIIDDTYNANPASVMAAADTLKEIKYDGRKIMILGHMNELGQYEKEEHLKTAEYIDGKADLIILAGPLSYLMSEKIVKSKCIPYKNRLEIENDIFKIINPGDLILIKASQNQNYFEELTKILLRDGINAGEVLVRQGREWKGKKNLLY